MGTGSKFLRGRLTTDVPNHTFVPKVPGVADAR